MNKDHEQSLFQQLQVAWGGLLNREKQAIVEELKRKEEVERQKQIEAEQKVSEIHRKNEIKQQEIRQWEAAKKVLQESLVEINKGVFDGRGKISQWVSKKGTYSINEPDTYGLSGDWSTDTYPGDKYMVSGTWEEIYLFTQKDGRDITITARGNISINKKYTRGFESKEIAEKEKDWPTSTQIAVLFGKNNNCWWAESSGDLIIKNEDMGTFEEKILTTFVDKTNSKSRLY